jgi:hypothetical protein
MRHRVRYTIWLQIFCPGWFHRCLIVIVMFPPTLGILFVEIQPAWRWDTNQSWISWRMPYLTRGRMRHTQQNTSDPCLGEVLSGGMLVLFMSVICVLCSALSCQPPGGVFLVQTQVSECHSKHLDLLFWGWTEQFWGGQTVRRPLWGQIVTKSKWFWVKSLLYRIARVRISQCLNGGWTSDQGPAHNTYLF